MAERLNWMLYHPHAAYALGSIPGWLDVDDPRPAREQLDEGYKFAGGWQPMQSPGLKISDRNAMLYPGDPPQAPLAMAMLRDEVVILYPHGFVGIIQPDRSFEVCRMD